MKTSLVLALALPLAHLYVWRNVSDDHGLDSDCDESTTFHCNFGGCIDKSRVCDFHTDCPLGEDEGLICGEFRLFYYTLLFFIIIQCTLPFSIALQCLASLFSI